MGRTAARPVLDERIERDRASAYLSKGRYDEAISLLRILVVFHGDDADLRLQLAEAYRRRGLRESSAATYREAAQLLVRQGNLSRARRVLAGALHLTPHEEQSLEDLRPARAPRKLALVKPPPPVIEVSDSDLIECPFDELAEEVGGECNTDPFCPVFQWLEETPQPGLPPLPAGMSTVVARPPRARKTEPATQKGEVAPALRVQRRVRK